MRKFTFVTVVIACIAVTTSAQAQGNNPSIFANEHGVGNITDLGGFVFNMPGVVAADPGPGGLPSALTYNLLGPPALVAGDLFIRN